ncbi:RHS repeat-associated core domain-containing protein [Pseudoalteromonas sp. R3]|uniref:RHS repeat-associated core domain-containing protein n=1 Tax=Pseudoalteromonas sp. R3 TaxID=1709477 RepID=UPI000FDD80D6|nr:RHS repeat-associated core domain-containing protein [Pseudoalteromonas sp. R3]AZZ96610.1 hypothetical protein ELR70_05200 [Pseudoalteromonas sp. R3]
MNGQAQDAPCFSDNGQQKRRKETQCYRSHKLTKTTSFVSLAGGGASNTVTLNMATRPNLTDIELSDDVVLPNASMAVRLKAWDDGQPVDKSRLSLCLVPGSGAEVTSCEGATPISADRLTGSEGIYTSTFNATAAPGQYALVMIVADDTNIQAAQALSAVPFTVQKSAGITLNYSSSNTQRTRGVEYSEQIEIGALSSEHSHVCRIALVEPNTASNGVLLASKKIDQPLPLLEDSPATVSATMKWTPGLALPKSLTVKVRAYLRTGSQCDEQADRFVDSTATYSYTLNSLVPVNPRLELVHDGAKKPGVIDITLTRNGGQSGDHATGYNIYEYVKNTSAAPPAQLNKWQHIATLSADNLELQTSIEKSALDHNKYAFYCAVATNTDHSGELKYSNADCDQTQIRNEGTAPPQAYFGNAGHFFGPYTLEIESERAYTAQSSLQWYFKLERKIGDGYWSTLVSKIPVSRFNEHGPEATYRVTSPTADQVVQYRVTAYNRNGAQSVPSTQTVQHTNAKIVGVTKGTNTREYIVSGAAFASTGNIVSVQQNTTGISHQLSAADITYVSSHELKIKVPASIDTAYSNGGFVVGVKNALRGASYATYNADSTSGQVDDPLNYTPTVGFNGQQYLGKGSAIYAEKDQRTQWYRRTGGTLSSRPIVTVSGSGSDVVFAGSQDHHIYAWSQIGTRLWKTPTRGPVEAEGLVVGDDQLSAQLFYGSADGALYVLNAKTGAIEYLYKLGATVSQKPFVVGNQIWAVTQDGQVHKLDRDAASLQPLQWGDMNSSALLSALNRDFPSGWTPDTDFRSAYHLLRLGYLVLGRDLTRYELSFLAYAVDHHNVTLFEVAQAMLTSEEGRRRFALSLSDEQFYDRLVELMHHVSANGLAGYDRAHWINSLKNGLPRAQFLLDVQWSSGFANTYNRAVASTLYYYYGACHLQAVCNELVDSDGDNISDVAETALGTNKLDPRDGLLDAPDLTLTLTGEGRIKAGFSYSRDLARFKLVDVASNTSPTTYPAANRKAEGVLIYPNGSHSFYAQACIDVALNPTTPGVTTEYCSTGSAQQSVTVLDSLTEGQITPHAAPVKPETVKPVSQSALQTHHKYSFTTGSFRVNEQGAATYSIPIAVPQGIAGVTPEVSLSYNSQQPESMIAQGWQLSAGSAITRCRQTLAQDGAFKPVSVGLDNEDRYCLDGQRLILIKGTSHGEAGAEYRTEIDSQQRIVVESGEEAYKVQFVVYGKDGSKRIYGGTENSQSGGPRYPTSWLLRQSMDSVAANSIASEPAVNVIKYRYRHGGENGDKDNALGRLETVLSSITYSRYTVTFEYQAGPVRNLAYSLEVVSLPMQAQAQLTGIRVSKGATPLHYYDLEFENGANGVRQLKSVRHCDKPVSSYGAQCKQPIIFDYEDSKTYPSMSASHTLIGAGSNEKIVATSVLDTDGNSEPELVTLIQQENLYQHELCLIDRNRTPSCQLIDTNTRLESVKMMPFDMEGDGTQGLLIQTTESRGNARSKWGYFTHDGSRWNEQALPGGMTFNQLRIGDVNGDGMVDLVSTDNTAHQELRLTLNQHISLDYQQDILRKLDNDAPFYLIDMDFDGKADLVTSKCATGGCTEPGKYDYIFIFYNRYDPANREHKFEVGTYSSQAVVHSSLMPMDVNGDGTLDVMYQNKDEDWEVALVRPSLGEGFRFDWDGITTLTAPANVTIDSKVAKWPPQLADLNGDGRPELYVTGKKTNSMEYGLYRYEFDPATRSFITPSWAAYRLNMAPTYNNTVFFADMDGDAIPELVAQNSFGITQYGRTFQQPAAGRLRTITQGLGNQTTIRYAAMSDASVYTQGDSAVTAQLQQDSGLKVTDLAGGSMLVREVETSALDTQTGDTSLVVTYEYEGARVQFGGRGWLGFAALTTVTEKDGHQIATRTEYEQAFPRTGMPKRTTKTLYVNGQPRVLSDAVDSYKVSPEQVEPKRVYQLYNQDSRTCSARVDSDYFIAGYDCSQTLTTQDSDGNVTNLQVSQYSINGAAEDFLQAAAPSGAISTVTTVNDFGSEAEQQLGRLKSATVTHERDGNTVTRNSAFTYIQSGELAGLLESETVEPEGSCDTYLKTTYRHDVFGNVLSKQVESKPGCNKAGEKISRTSTTTYDGEGRYVTEQHNGLFTTLLVESRNKYGQVTQAKNADGVVQSTEYDAFGGEIGSYSPSGAQQRTLMAECPAGAPAYCAFASESYVNTELVARSFFDRLGRTLGKERLTSKGMWLRDVSHYDKHGRATVVTPAGQAPTSTQYDVLDRVTQVTDEQSGLITTLSVTGRITKTTVSGNIPGGSQETVVTHNQHGEKHTVTDPAGQVLTYTYTTQGLLDTVSSSADGGTPLIDNDYNDLTGRKTSTKDRDRGHWQYTYNALGELLVQTDANGDKLSFEYDALGRKTTLKINNVVDSEWHYDTDKPWRLDQEVRGSWSRSYLYDGLGRQVASVTDLESDLSCKGQVSYEPATKDVRITDALASVHNAKCVVQLTTFDEYGRVFQQFDDYRRTRDRGRFVEARGQRLYYSAGQVDKKQEAREGDRGQLYYVADSHDAAGRVTRYQKGHFSMAVGYDSRGQLSTLGVAQESAYRYIQQHSYTFDAMGNLTSRALNAEDTATTFGYDKLNRVTTVNGVERYVYDPNGNLRHKDGWTQKYGKAGEPLHAIYERVKGAQTETFDYDANSNQLSATVHLNGRVHTRTLDYSARNKVTSITQSGETVTFAYDANNRRYKRTEGNKTIYYVGALEIVDEGTDGGEFANQKYIRRSINGDAVQTYHPNGQASMQWLFTDHQGSVVAITDNAGKFLKRFKYDVFGKQSEIVRPPNSDASYANWSTASMGIFTRVPANSRSYTGHEPITLGGDNRIIHMNGRVYDADTGRFMQADPFVQAPNNLQNYNAYTYVLNNPLSYTDPSGYIFDKLTKVIGFTTNGLIGAIVAHHTQRFIANSSTLSTLYVASASIASSAICGPCSIVATAYVSAQNTYYRTGDFGAAIKAGAVSGVSAAAFYAVGSAFEGVNTSFGSAGYFGKVAAHGLVGGTMSVIQGGKFGHGFAAAGFTQALAPAIGRIQPGVKHSPLRIAAAAIVGGTASKISGGKFANGAVTAAFSRGFNDELHPQKAQFSYDESDPYYHKYEMDNEICSLSTEGCSAGAVWGELKKNPAPGWDNSKQVATGDETEIEFAFLSGGTVSHIVDDKNMTLYNMTHSDHIFSDGYVSRSVYVRGGSVYVKSIGEGITSPGTFRLGGVIPISRAIRGTLNMKLYKAGFDGLDNNIRSAF